MIEKNKNKKKEEEEEEKITCIRRLCKTWDLSICCKLDFQSFFLL